MRSKNFPNLEPITPGKAQAIIAQLHAETLNLATVDTSLDKLELPDTVLGDTWHIVRSSSPGTYRHLVEKDPNYAPLNVGGFERAADDAAATLGILLAGQLAGKDFLNITKSRVLFTTDKNLQIRTQIRAALLANSAVSFVYTGDPSQTTQIRRTIRNPKHLYQQKQSLYLMKTSKKLTNRWSV